MKANKTIRWKAIDIKRGSIKIREYPNVFGFTRLYYNKDRITIAPNDSIGNCCFDSKKRAIEWLNGQVNEGKVIKVKTYGKGIRPIIRNILSLEDNAPFPEGTICYPAVMPLE